ncbi:MAG: hypothetical protein HYS32_02560 [Candidatus Woesearchaeota archaeon]|nr:MAG: hypothetical protein HYS32_02560 [Candidatus Woesearchaeota archaeon]
MEQENPKKLDRTVTIFVSVVVIIFIGVILYLSFGKGSITAGTVLSEDHFLYKGEYEVTRVDPITYIIKGFIGEQPINIHLRTDPRNVENIPSESDIKTKLIPSKEIFITANPNLTSNTLIAAVEISKITGNPSLFNIQTQGALTKTVGNSTLPIKTCKEATKESKVILLQLADETKIHSEGNCIIIDGETQDDLIRAADKLVLQLLEIIK